MDSIIQKWGNSLALRVPSALAKSLGLRRGSMVSLALEDGALLVKPLKERRYSLARLLAGVTPANRHDEADWGRPSGREDW